MLSGWRLITHRLNLKLPRVMFKSTPPSLDKIRPITQANLETNSCRLLSSLPGDIRPLSPVVDINLEDMMMEEKELILPEYDEASSDDEGSAINPLGKAYEGPPPVINSTNFGGAPLAPIDIDAWADEEDECEGTVEEETVRKQRADEHIVPELPPIPKDRSGIYKFRGITVMLPKSMLKPEFYRYRLDPDEAKVVPDDLRVCCFEPE